MSIPRPAPTRCACRAVWQPLRGGRLLFIPAATAARCARSGMGIYVICVYSVPHDYATIPVLCIVWRYAGSELFFALWLACHDLCIFAGLYICCARAQQRVGGFRRPYGTTTPYASISLSRGTRRSACSRRARFNGNVSRVCINRQRASRMAAFSSPASFTCSDPPPCHTSAWDLISRASRWYVGP